MVVGKRACCANMAESSGRNEAHQQNIRTKSVEESWEKVLREQAVECIYRSTCEMENSKRTTRYPFGQRICKKFSSKKLEETSQRQRGMLVFSGDYSQADLNWIVLLGIQYNQR